MLVSDVVTAVRKRLGDDVKERWDIDTLVLYTSLCQSDICIHTNYHRKRYIMPLYEGQLIYNLPADCIRVERMEYEGEFFPIETRNSIDRGEAKYPCALKDNLEFGEIEIRLEKYDSTIQSELENAFGVVSSTDISVLDNKFGVVSSIDDLTNPNPGDTPVVGYIIVYYSAVPPLAVDDTVTLLLPDMWISAFIHFVTGMALQDDNDANNIQRGEFELQKYNRMLEAILKTSAKDFTTNYKSKLETPYRRT